MKTGHLEIVKAMQDLLTPDPMSGVVKYEPVLDRLIGLYGSNVDNPDLHTYACTHSHTDI